MNHKKKELEYVQKYPKADSVQNLVCENVNIEPLPYILEQFNQEFEDSKDDYKMLLELQEQLTQYLNEGYNVTDLLFKVEDMLGSNLQAFKSQLKILKHKQDVILENITDRKNYDSAFPHAELEYSTAELKNFWNTVKESKLAQEEKDEIELQIQQIENEARLNLSMVENYNRYKVHFDGLEKKGEFLQKPYYEAVDLMEDDNELLIEQTENLEQRVIDVDYDEERLNNELNLVELYPDDYNNNVTRGKKANHRVNSRVRVKDIHSITKMNSAINSAANSTTRKKFAQHVFDGKLSNIIVKCINNSKHFRNLTEAQKKAFIFNFKQVAEYVRNDADNILRYKNAQEYCKLNEITVNAIKAISYNIQIQTKGMQIFTGRSVKTISDEAKKAISNGAISKVKEVKNGTGGMRLKDIRKDIIDLAINNVLTPSQGR